MSGKENQREPRSDTTTSDDDENSNKQCTKCKKFPEPDLPFCHFCGHGFTTICYKCQVSSTLGMKPCTGCEHESCERCATNVVEDGDPTCCSCNLERIMWDFFKCHGCGHEACDDCSWAQGWDDGEKEVGKMSSCQMQ
jgi:hypothetical protein